MINFSQDNGLLLFLVVLWTLPWKGVALWKAAHKENKRWFIALLLLNTLGVLEIIYIFFWSSRPAHQHHKETHS